MSHAQPDMCSTKESSSIRPFIVHSCSHTRVALGSILVGAYSRRSLYLHLWHCDGIRNGRCATPLAAGYGAVAAALERSCRGSAGGCGCCIASDLCAGAAGELTAHIHMPSLTLAGAQISHPTGSTMIEGSLNWMSTALVLSSFTVVVLGMMCRFLPETRGQSLEGSTREPTSPRGVPTRDEHEGNTVASPLTNHLASGSVSPPGNPSLVAYQSADGMLSAHSSSSSVESLGLVFASVPSIQGNNFSRQHSGINNQWSNSQSQLSKSSFLTAATTNSAIGQNFSRQNSSLDISGGGTNMNKSSSRASLVAMPPVPPKGDARGR